LAWLKKIYRFDQKEFDRSVVKAIKGLYEDIDENAYYSAHLNELLENPESHLYLAQIKLPVNIDTLTSYLQYELEDFGIFTDCQLGLYNSALNQYSYTRILTSAGASEKIKKNLPIVTRKFDYIALYFPNREQYILSQLNFWILSSVILLIVLILFSASLYYFYRQKFLNEIQKDFIHNFTHEFKTPVSVINLAADVLKSENISEKPEKLATYARIVEYQSHYLQGQIEKLLQFAYTGSGHLHLEKENVNMNEIIKGAVNNLAPVIAEKNANIIYELNASQPVLKADRGYMLITITNLLDNAIKYSRYPEIKISTKNGDNTLQIFIQDNGLGIEKSQLKKIFRKFYRIRSGDTYVAKGFGIGLSFVKTIIDAHGGKIKIESTPGKGSTFMIELLLQ
jgi:two-component system phosphate regulon sensor histidine kinase PhoR